MSAALLLACAFAQAEPFTPTNDDEVVEKLPSSAADPSVRRVDSLRRQLAARPDDAALRLEIGRRYFDMAMAQGDPRYVGYAMAAIKPLDRLSPNDPGYWLVRGLLEQYSHDFAGGMKSLARASELDPKAPEPVAWRAAIDMVQARYDDARTECTRLETLAHPLYARSCLDYVRATTGQLAPAYEDLKAALAAAGPLPAELVMWVQTRLGEWADRLGRTQDAEAHYQTALKQGVTDQFLLGAYSDFLLAHQRPAEVTRLLADWERSDILLLRLALAGKAANDKRAKGWADQLRDRFDAATQRGDRLHEQEAARFELDVEGKPDRALDYAARNYGTQKEPRDAEVLLRTALAAHKPAAAQPALDWMRATGYEDPAMAALATQLVAQGAHR
ncbi:hypothetical protein IM725_01890 [Ramlibacter aquaticus]|uniref:Tetratricopeptide repeat protein n=1 Tax=Ramlibacter aquaticus TaxID=2780094 RepID=A0ABR9SAJ5_9BURK|nr:hypothetical protein [Ramlibacter aquaticus]